MTSSEILRLAWASGRVVPAFNIPYLPMVAPVVSALRDTNSFGLVMVARLEWMKFQSESLEAVASEYHRFKDSRHTRLHLDHIPVIDEDGNRVDYCDDIQRAIDAGYESVMIDGSRLSLVENILCTREVVKLAHGFGIPVEAELGAVLGHEDGPLPDYDDLFASGRGFTEVSEAKTFVDETGVDWLSVAVGSIHGAISGAAKSERKLEARLSIERLKAINAVTKRPLVLHGGTGIRKECIFSAVQSGIAKINVGTAIRQPYEQAKQQSVAAGQQAVYDAMLRVINYDLELAGSAQHYLAQTSEIF